MLKLFIAFIVAFGIFLFFRGLRGIMLIPVVKGQNTALEITVRVNGQEEKLQHTLEGLIWLRENGTLHADISIIGKALDEDTRYVAQSYAKERKHITFTEE